MHVYNINIGPFVEHMSEVESYLLTAFHRRGILTQHDIDNYHHNSDPSHSPHNYGDLVVMVVNEGEIDLLANLACSCERSGIDKLRMVVFTPSAHLLPYVEALGFLGLHHESFAYASHEASAE